MPELFRFWLPRRKPAYRRRPRRRGRSSRSVHRAVRGNVSSCR